MSDEMPSSLRKPEVRRILRAIKDGKVTEFNPSFSYEKGIFYPDVEKIIPELSIDYGLFEDLERYGIVRREFHDSISACPSCGSHKVFIKLRCPSCGSTEIDKGNTIEHLNCGYVDLEERFVEGEKLICPKCGRELRALGVDYRRPGAFFKCGSCGSVRAISEHEYICGECGEIFTENQLNIKKFFRFIVEPEGKALVDRWMINFDDLIDNLQKEGYVAKHSAVLKGSSGVEHNFKLAVWDLKTSDKVKYVIDVEVEENEVTEIKVLSFFAKAFDVRAEKRVLVAIPSLTQKAREMAKNYNILVVENLDPSGVVSAVLDVIKKGDAIESVQ